MQKTSIIIVGGFLLAGCVGAPNQPLEVQAESALRKGVDYDWTRPMVADLTSDADTFAARYVGRNMTGKNIDKGEADGLIAAAIDIVLVSEYGAMDALQGQQRGHDDAVIAEGQAKAVGMPATRPIYFAVDFDAQPTDDSAIHAYLDGAASVLGKSRVGLYSGYGPIKRAFDAGKIAYGWQTYAWSGGQWDARAQLRQTLNGISVGGSSGCCDRDEATADDFGQWGKTSPPPPDMAQIGGADLAGGQGDAATGTGDDLAGSGGSGGGGGGAGGGGAGGAGDNPGQPNHSHSGCSAVGGDAATDAFATLLLLGAVSARRRFARR
jgi:glycoside hydrolase-like protein